MVKSDIKRITEIVRGDKKYSHLADRVSKDYSDSVTKGIPVAMQAFFCEAASSQDAGFAVISISPLKMKSWQKVFIEEGWVQKDFRTNVASFELMYLYVRPEMRRQGIGGLLFSKVMKYAYKNGIKSIYAYVSDTNHFSLNFYLKNNAKIIHNFSDEGNTAAFISWEKISKD